MKRKDTPKLDEKAKDYIILYIHLNGLIFIEKSKTANEIRKIIFEKELNIEDYAVFKGSVVKEFI